MDSVVDSTQQFKNANMTVWQDRTASKCRRLNNSIPIEWRVEYPPFQGGSVMPVAHDCGILTADELLITESSATDLVDHMAAGHLTAVAVTTAFCKRAAIAHQMVRSPSSATLLQLPVVSYPSELMITNRQIAYFLFSSKRLSLARKSWMTTSRHMGSQLGRYTVCLFHSRTKCGLKYNKAVFSLFYCCLTCL